MKEISLENKLRYLYALQQIDLKLDELEELKGDLPQLVNELKSKVDSLKKSLQELETQIKSNKIKSEEADTEILDLTEKIEKYKKQQYQVKNNKQYDALTREIENSQKKIEQLNKDIDLFDGNFANAKEELQRIKEELALSAAELNEKQEELDTVSKENEEEELSLQHQREKIIARIKKDDRQLYERIRKAKNGNAIVPVKRNACSGCFNSVPPQKMLELRQNEKLFTCEHCGRILVSDKIVEISSGLL
jgi:uncharacterized protein